MMSIRYLGCVEAGGVSYENINMDQINSLCSEGFAKVRILQFLIRILSFFSKDICYKSTDNIKTKH